jgi:hypothetical protein
MASMKKIATYKRKVRTQTQGTFFKATNQKASQEKTDTFFRPPVIQEKNVIESSNVFIQRLPFSPFDDFDLGVLTGTYTGVVPNLNVAIASYGLPGGLPQRLLANYVYGNGRPYKLSIFEMNECKPSYPDLTKTQEYKTARLTLKNIGDSASINLKIPGGAGLSGTLGQFTAIVIGTIKLLAGNKVRLEGTLSFYDRYDFDPHLGKTRRSTAGQFKTGFGSTLPGKPFIITSEAAPISINIEW